MCENEGVNVRERICEYNTNTVVVYLCLYEQSL